jgi:hypothetical protein
MASICAVKTMKYVYIYEGALDLFWYDMHCDANHDGLALVLSDIIPDYLID